MAWFTSWLLLLRVHLMYVHLFQPHFVKMADNLTYAAHPRKLSRFRLLLVSIYHPQDIHFSLVVVNVATQAMVHYDSLSSARRLLETKRHVLPWMASLFPEFAKIPWITTGSLAGVLVRDSLAWDINALLIRCVFSALSFSCLHFLTSVLLPLSPHLCSPISVLPPLFSCLCSLASLKTNKSGETLIRSAG